MTTARHMASGGFEIERHAPQAFCLASGLWPTGSGRASGGDIWKQVKWRGFASPGGVR
jgi:hypothetical protein